MSIENVKGRALGAGGVCAKKKRNWAGTALGGEAASAERVGLGCGALGAGLLAICLLSALTLPYGVTFGKDYHDLVVEVGADVCTDALRYPSTDREELKEGVPLNLYQYDDSDDADEQLVTSGILVKLKRMSTLQDIYNRFNLGPLGESDFLTTEFYATIAVGSPPQELAVVVDTGSATLWVPSAQAFQLCGFQTGFAHGRSTTYNANGTPFTMRYANGNVTGFLSSEEVSLGGARARVTLGEATDCRGLGLAYLFGKFGGVLGLAWPALSADGSTPLVPALRAAGALPRARFSLFFGQSGRCTHRRALLNAFNAHLKEEFIDLDNNLQWDDCPGWLLLGALDPRHFVGPMVWLPLVALDYWTVALQVGYVEGPADDGDAPLVFARKTSVSFNSGTSLIEGPGVEALWTALGARRIHFFQKQRYVPCSALIDAPSLVFQLDGFALRLTPYDYSVRVGYDTCLLALKQADKWVFGDTVMRKFYTVYDYDKQSVGIALST